MGVQLLTSEKQTTPQRGLVYRSGVLDWDNLISCVITDASHANEHEVMTVDTEDSLELLRKQGLIAWARLA